MKRDKIALNPVMNADIPEPELYRLMVESATRHAMFALHPDGTVRTWNAGLRRLLGFRAEDIVGRHVEAIYPREARLMDEPQLALEVVNGGGVYDAEGIRARKNGTTFWAHTEINGLRDAAGTLIGFGVVVRDLSAERGTRDRLDLLATTIEDHTDCVLITDAQLDLPGPRILYANKSFERMSGYRLEELIGRTPRLFQGADTDRAMLARLRTALTQRRIFVAETINYTKDGRPYRVRWQIAPLFNNNGEPTHFVSVQHEVGAHAPVNHPNFTEVARILDFTVLGGAMAPSTTFRGRLENVGGAASLVQMLAAAGLDGALTLGEDMGLHLRGGRIVHVKHPRFSGAEAAVDAFGLEAGAFDFTATEQQPAPVLDINPVNIALEAARRTDEAKATGEWAQIVDQTGSLGVVVVANVNIAATFAAGIGSGHFRARLERDPTWHGERVVLSGRGFCVVAVEGTLAEVPPEITRWG